MLGFLKTGLGQLLLAALLLSGAYLIGQHNGRKSDEIDRLNRQHQTQKDLKELEDETGSISDNDLIDRISR